MSSRDAQPLPRSQSNRSGFETPTQKSHIHSIGRSQSNRSGFETASSGDGWGRESGLNPTVVVLKLDGANLRGATLDGLNPTVVVLKLFLSPWMR